RINRCSFTYQIIFNCFAKAPIDDVVSRPGQRRLKSTTDLVIALRAGVESGDALLDAELDALVVTGLEMQAVVVVGAAPVAPEQGVPGPEEDGGSDRRAALNRQFHH